MSKYLLLVSLDAISDADVDVLLKQPCFSAMAASGRLTRGVCSVPTSNTYPNHVSAATGKYPAEHGLWSNTRFIPGGAEEWNCYAKDIQSPTIFNLVKKSGRESCAILWPVTGGESDIKYNLPEMHRKPGQSQLMLNLRYGSPWYQVRLLGKLFLAHIRFSIQTLDRFSTACACETIVKFKPALLALHLIAADTIKHEHGPDSQQALQEIVGMDVQLRRLMNALDRAGIREDTAVLVMGDHACLPVRRTIDLNAHMRRRGTLGNGEWSACFHQMGGTAILMVKDIHDAENVSRETLFINELLSDPNSGVGRIIPPEQFHNAGYPSNAILCIEAAPGCEFAEEGKSHRGNHGYGTDREGYRTFHMLHKPGMKPEVVHGGEVTDVFGIVCKELGLSEK